MGPAGNLIVRQGTIVMAALKGTAGSSGVGERKAPRHISVEVGGCTLAEGPIRGMGTLRRAAAEARANSVLGLRNGARQSKNGNPCVFLYGTLAAFG